MKMIPRLLRWRLPRAYKEARGRARFLAGFLCLLAGVGTGNNSVLAATPSDTPDANKQPNILMIVVDDCVYR